MPPKRPSGTQADSDSDSDAPEAVSLSSSKKISEAQAKTIRLHESSQQIKKKNENRERDRLLKEEKAKRNEADDSSKKLKSKEHVRMNAAEERMERAMRQAAERMERAMRQAAEENSDGEDDEVDHGTGDDDEDDDEDDSDDDESMDEDDEEVEEEWGGIANEDQDPDITTKQLPDHIFAAAASKSIIKQSSKSSVNRTQPDKKKKRKENRAKELIVGGRSIKLLPSASPVGEGYQSQHINKFMKTQLQLRNQEVTVATTPSLTKRSGPVGRQKIPSKGGSKVGGRGSKDWHRIPVNLGAMRRYNGPANKFVRDAVSMRPITSQKVMYNIPNQIPIDTFGHLKVPLCDTTSR